MALSQSSDALRRIFPRGADVPIVVRQVSRSGMQRTLDVLHADTLVSLAQEVAAVTGDAYDAQHRGVRLAAPAAT